MSETASTPRAPAAPSGERRHVTVLFADMIGFTEISERLGEEGTFALIQPIYELMARAVKEQGGSVKDFTGDGIMALFGAPEALEDAPLRACRAALLIHERLAAAAPEIEAKNGVRPQMRIGVNSGLAVVTQIRGENTATTALGDTVNLAARLQTLAEPGTAALSEATERLVRGLVETTFAGVHPIKGKAEPQKVWRLDSLRQGATRFDAARGRGLSAYVGRERELEILECSFVESRSELRVIDVVAEPGMGKSRLLHEFRQRIGDDKIFVLSGSCSPDGKQTPFFPFIEIVRGSFQVESGQTASDVARKLETGLNLLALYSPENCGLLLNLLGYRPAEDMLAGLDSVLVGLRTRDLLQNLLSARRRLSAVVLLIEDLHWIDSVSQELLAKLLEDEAKPSLLLLHTRRPEYEPPWRDRDVVSTLVLLPLPTGEIRRLIQTRLGVEALPEALVRQVTGKAEGNALFAEEILSFLAERGVLRIFSGKVEFDASALAASLPASLQNLLTARVDRLPPPDRALLQAAAVIGRRFDPRLLAVVVPETSDIDTRLAAMQALDLVSPEGRSGDYSFKHALVRDALYQSLLAAPRSLLHLKIAEEVERRSNNNLLDAAETLAHHYGQTDRSDKAFRYFSIAGAKSLGVYYFEEAGHHFDAAIALIDRTPGCADDHQLAEMLSNYTQYTHLTTQYRKTIETVTRFTPRLESVSPNSDYVLIQRNFTHSLLYAARTKEAQATQASASASVSKLSDARAIAYTLANDLYLSSMLSPKSINEFEAISREAIAAAANVNDADLQYYVRFVVGYEAMIRGRTDLVDVAAQELLSVGRLMNDPRSIGYAMTLRAFTALSSENFELAIEFAEAGITSARAPLDQENSKIAKLGALVFLRRPGAFETFRDSRKQWAKNGWDFILDVSDGVWGVALTIHGEIGAGIRHIEQSILKRDLEGHRLLADTSRSYLCAIYLEIISGTERPSAKLLLRNLPTLLTVMFTARRRIVCLVHEIQQNPRYDPNGFVIGRCEMYLGLLYKAKKKRALAFQHLTEAKRIISQFGPTPVLAKIDAALAEMR